MNINKPMFGPVVLEITCPIVINKTPPLHLENVVRMKCIKKSGVYM